MHEHDEGYGTVRARLQDLVAQYSFLVDGHDLTGLLDLFEPQAVFTRGNLRFEGTAELREFFARTMDHYTLMVHMPYMQTVHWVGGTRATGRVAAMAHLWIDGVMHQAAFQYTDEYALSEAGWRFAARDLQFVYALPVSELATPVTGPERIRWPGSAPDVAGLPESLPTWRSHRADVRPTPREETTP